LESNASVKVPVVFEEDVDLEVDESSFGGEDEADSAAVATDAPDADADPVEGEGERYASVDPAATVKLSREMIESSWRREPEGPVDDGLAADGGEAGPSELESEAETLAAGASLEKGEEEAPVEDVAAEGKEHGADEAFDPELEDTDAVPVDDRFYAAVDQFNRRHSIVFKNLRLEIGAGIKNYVSNCCARLGDLGEAFSGTEPDKEGRYDRERLARFLAQIWPEEPDRPLDALIRVELDTVRDLLPPRRLAEIEDSLTEVGG
ncbi:MAG: hypothetical protein OEQ13_08875, partial [Acidobacteriota bacterium]|nr:hypothetical protein [Acidobacteriota bacterium]